MNWRIQGQETASDRHGNFFPSVSSAFRRSSSTEGEDSEMRMPDRREILEKRGRISDRAEIERRWNMLLAYLKRLLKLDRLRLRGPSGARDEFLLAAIAQSLRRMARRLCPSTPRFRFAAT